MMKSIRKMKDINSQKQLLYLIFFSKDKNMMLSLKTCSVRRRIWHLLTQMKRADLEHLGIFNFQLCIPKKKNDKVFHKRTSKDFTFY